MDWLDLVAVQGTLKSLLQHHSSKASILWCSAFFIVQLSHPYMTTGKTIALTRRSFVGKVMSLLFNMLSRLVITFLPKSKRLLISWLQSPPAVILEPGKIKSATVSTVYPSICHEVKGAAWSREGVTEHVCTREGKRLSSKGDEVNQLGKKCRGNILKKIGWGHQQQKETFWDHRKFQNSMAENSRPWRGDGYINVCNHPYALKMGITYCI